MSVREFLLAVILLSALGLIVTGVQMWSIPAALVLAGVGLAGLGILFLTEVAG